MVIESYRFGQIVIDNKVYTSDLKIINGVVKDNWWRSEGHVVSPSDIDDIMAARPDIVIIGTGASGMMKLAPGLSKAFTDKGIKVEALLTKLAAKRFNELVSRLGPSKVAFAAHLTC